MMNAAFSPAGCLLRLGCWRDAGGIGRWACAAFRAELLVTLSLRRRICHHAAVMHITFYCTTRRPRRREDVRFTACSPMLFSRR